MTVILGQMNIVHSLTSPFLNASFNITVPLMPTSLKVDSALYIPTKISHGFVTSPMHTSLLVKMTRYGTLHYAAFSSLLLHSLSRVSIKVNAVNTWPDSTYQQSSCTLKTVLQELDRYQEKTVLLSWSLRLRTSSTLSTLADLVPEINITWIQIQIMFKHSPVSMSLTHTHLALLQNAWDRHAPLQKKSQYSPILFVCELQKITLLVSRCLEMPAASRVY